MTQREDLLREAWEEGFPLSGSSLNMRNFESARRWGVTVDDAGGAFCAAFGRPRREVVEDSAGFRIAGTDFVTIDRPLAEAVAAEYDRIDPLGPPMYRVGENGPEETL